METLSVYFLALHSKKFAGSSHSCSCLTLISPAASRLINKKCHFHAAAQRPDTAVQSTRHPAPIRAGEYTCLWEEKPPGPCLWSRCSLPVRKLSWPSMAKRTTNLPFVNLGTLPGSCSASTAPCTYPWDPALTTLHRNHLFVCLSPQLQQDSRGQGASFLIS